MINVAENSSNGSIVKSSKSIEINGINDLGISSSVNVTLSSEVMNAFRIMLKMLFPHGEIILPPSEKAVFKAPVIEASYSDNIEADGQAHNASIRAYKSPSGLKILISPMKYSSVVNTDYSGWYERKSMNLVTIESCDTIFKTIDKLDKLYPYEVANPENEPSYKYIDS